MRNNDHRGIKGMSARAFGAQSFHQLPAETPKPQPKPDMISVSQFDAKLGRFVDRMVANPEVHPMRCEECGCTVRVQDAMNYLGPLGGDGFMRNAVVCRTCFEVLP